MRERFVSVPVSQFRAEAVQVPGDKSISHRALFFAALAEGQSEISGLLESDDVLSTLRALKSLGVEIEKDGDRWFVQGRGPQAFQAPLTPIDCGNSGTTMRLLLGILAGQNLGVPVTLTGDASLKKRPMKRVAEPLVKMGARIQLSEGGFAPLQIQGGHLQALDYDLPLASAQLKSALLLAALSARGVTRLRGKIASRDHTERMLRQFGVVLAGSAELLELTGGQKLLPQNVRVPGDPSSAAFWMTAAALVPLGFARIEGVSLNPTRTGFFEILKRMGAEVRTGVMSGAESEPVGWVEVRQAELHGCEVMPAEVPFLIDELPLVAILGARAKGVTLVCGAEELRVKETDRIDAVARNLRALGVGLETFPDGFRIEGSQAIQSGVVESFHDHRIAMAFAVAGLVAQGPVEIRDAPCVAISYPTFFEDLRKWTYE